MTLTQLAQKLLALGYPVAYSHFKSTQTPPFICYFDQGSGNFSADNETYHEVEFVDIELYSTKKDLVIERKIKDLLKENKLPYTKAPPVWIESEGVFQFIFTIQLI